MFKKNNDNEKLIKDIATDIVKEQLTDIVKEQFGSIKDHIEKNVSEFVESKIETFNNEFDEFKKQYAENNENETGVSKQFDDNDDDIPPEDDLSHFDIFK